jgi:hypothetical protein
MNIRRRKGESAILSSCLRHGRRPDPAEFDRPLNRAELAEHQRRLSMINPYRVAEEYWRTREA